MPQSVTLSLRLTHKYRDGWSEPDRWLDLGPVRVIHGRQHYESEDGDFRSRLFLDAPAGFRPEVIRRAIASTFSHSDCRHEYDCCGCISTYATDIQRIGRRRWTFSLRGYPNY